MRKVFVAVGYYGRKFEEITADLKRAEEWIFNNIFEPGFEDVEVIDNFECPAPENAGRLWYLGEAIKKLGDCDTCFFAKGWANYKGCRAEMEICKLYGIKIIEE